MAKVKLVKVEAWVSEDVKRTMDKIASERLTTRSRLVSTAIYQELQKDEPFLLDRSIMNEEVEEYAYAKEAAIILAHLKTKQRPTPLDLVELIHKEIGIPSRENFLLGFKELLDKDMLSMSIVAEGDKVNYRVGTKLYCVPEKSKTSKQLNKEAKEYARYLRLQKKYGDVK